MSSEAKERGEGEEEQQQHHCDSCDTSFDTPESFAEHNRTAHAATVGSGKESEKIQKDMAQK